MNQFKNISFKNFSKQKKKIAIKKIKSKFDKRKTKRW
jgi:hypothetical protein